MAVLPGGAWTDGEAVHVDETCDVVRRKNECRGGSGPSAGKADAKPSRAESGGVLQELLHAIATPGRPRLSREGEPLPLCAAHGRGLLAGSGLCVG